MASLQTKWRLKIFKKHINHEWFIFFLFRFKKNWPFLFMFCSCSLERESKSDEEKEKEAERVSNIESNKKNLVMRVFKNSHLFNKKFKCNLSNFNSLFRTIKLENYLLINCSFILKIDSGCLQKSLCEWIW